MRLLLILAAVVALAACGSGGDTVQSGPPNTSAPAPAGHTYVATAVAGHTLVDGTEVTVTFNRDGNLSVQAGCNTLGTTYTIKDGRLVADDFGGTEMGCDAPRHAQDEWIAEFLSSRPTIAAQFDGLILVAGDTTMTMRDRETVKPDRSVTDTTWIADTIITGDSASSVPQTPKVSVTFKDGKVQGTDGCNTLSGPAEVGATTIRFGPVISTQMACPDPSPAATPLHQLFAAGTVTAEVDADRLTLTAADGTGLGFRAVAAG